ncbi:MAG: hypothetical protein LAO77_25410 [Acidobacteriia bacterium]|nr:hypothetical protein [Terriglobia bacterium]
MFSRLIPTILAALALAAPASAQTSVQGTWTVELHTGKAFLQLRTDAPPDQNRGSDWNGGWSMGQSVDLDQIAGLPPNDDHLSATNVKFELRREAGLLAFEGSFRDGRGAGLFTFTPRAEFTADMRRLGYTEDIPLWQRYQFAVQDVGPRFINALKTGGFDKLTLEQVRRTRNHGVTIEYIKAMKAEGYRAATLEDFVRTKDHGVTPAYVQDMRKAGFKDASIEDLVRAKDHGVTAQFVQEMRGLGTTVTTLDGCVRLRDHGVTAAYVRDLGTQGFKNVSLEEALRTKDHGVSADYIADMKQLGLKDLTLDQIVRLRDHGVTPGFVSHARARGYKPVDAEELIRLKNRGLL